MSLLWINISYKSCILLHITYLCCEWTFQIKVVILLHIIQLCCEWTFKTKVYCTVHYTSVLWMNISSKNCILLQVTYLCHEWTFERVNMPWFVHACVVNEHSKEKPRLGSYMSVLWTNIWKSKHTMVIHACVVNEYFKQKIVFYCTLHIATVVWG